MKNIILCLTFLIIFLGCRRNQLNEKDIEINVISCSNHSTVYGLDTLFWRDETLVRYIIELENKTNNLVKFDRAYMCYYLPQEDLVCKKIFKWNERLEYLTKDTSEVFITVDKILDETSYHDFASQELIFIYSLSDIDEIKFVKRVPKIVFSYLSKPNEVVKSIRN